MIRLEGGHVPDRAMMQLGGGHVPDNHTPCSCGAKLFNNKEGFVIVILMSGISGFLEPYKVALSYISFVVRNNNIIESEDHAHSQRVENTAYCMRPALINYEMSDDVRAIVLSYFTVAQCKE